MPRPTFEPYTSAQRKALRILALKCDQKTGRTEPCVWPNPQNSQAENFIAFAAMRVLGIGDGECWQRPAAAAVPCV